jgi:hypothetical protein
MPYLANGAPPPRRAIFSTPPPLPVSGENPAAQPCPAQPPLLPRGVPTGHATARPLAKLRRPRHRATALCAHAASAGVGQLGQANSVGPQAEMPAQHCAAIFRFSIFI